MHQRQAISLGSCYYIPAVRVDFGDREVSTFRRDECLLNEFARGQWTKPSVKSLVLLPFYGDLNAASVSDL